MCEFALPNTALGLASAEPILDTAKGIHLDVYDPLRAEMVPAILASSQDHLLKDANTESQRCRSRLHSGRVLHIQQGYRIVRVLKVRPPVSRGSPRSLLDIRMHLPCFGNSTSAGAQTNKGRLPSSRQAVSAFLIAWGVCVSLLHLCQYAADVVGFRRLLRRGGYERSAPDCELLPAMAASSG